LWALKYIQFNLCVCFGLFILNNVLGPLAVVFQVFAIAQRAEKMGACILYFIITALGVEWWEKCTFLLFWICFV